VSNAATDLTKIDERNQAMNLDNREAVTYALREMLQAGVQAHNAASEDGGLTGSVRELIFGINTTVDALAFIIEDAEPESDGARQIAAERRRQVDVEGWTPEHDDEADSAELARAALCYADEAAVQASGRRHVDESRPAWPWDESWWKPSADPIRNLVKAGALIAAEIDRLQRGRGE
jgi:hypothetical protein